tara:strand:- start:460 stop:645 length:186 start_codon:yes stop_codon:yes gene_type:complete
MEEVINNRDVELKAFMQSCWKNYKSTGDINCLVEAVEAAPFFGETELAEEVARILRARCFI